jgi:threonine dehydrogenase-like Zn-dependent dehydrogenase
VSSGICGSDLHLLEWGPSSVVLGHEIGGHLDDGTPVAVWPLRPCQACDRCHAGEIQQCRTAPSRIYGLSADGGMADRVLVDAASVIPLPSGVDARDGCLVEPIACSVHAARRAGIAPDDTVAVIGAGSIGLAAAAAARWMGASVSVAARHDRQRDAARSIGASLDPEGEHDVVIDAAGTSASIARAFQLLRPGGTVALVATPWSPLELPAFFTTKEPTVVTANMHGYRDAHTPDDTDTDMHAAAALLADLPEVAGAMITHRFPLDQAAAAFAAASDRSAGAIKVVLEP